jgi:acetylornithine deacetylase
VRHAGPEAAIAHLDRLVAWPTISARPVTGLAAWLAGRAESAGFTVDRFDVAEHKVNLVCRKGPRSQDRSRGLVLSGHMDVVPVEGQNWSSDPFKLTHRDGRLYGRGACDMKGFIAATVAACAALVDTPLNHELALVWTCDEEVGCQGSADLVDKIEAKPIDPLPRPTVIGEPTSFQICRLHPGHASWRIVCEGRPAHSSRPSLGLSAIKLAASALMSLYELEATLTAERQFEEDLPSPWAVLNTALISGGSAINIVPDRCEITVGARPLPGQDASGITRQLQKRVDRLDEVAQRDGGRIWLEELHATPSMLTAADCGHLHLLQPWAPDPRPTGAPFATDGGQLARLGCEPLVFGPGSIDQAHRPDEYIEQSDLLTTVGVVTDLVQRACAAR